jgi:hypothetical protein
MPRRDPNAFYHDARRLAHQGEEGELYFDLDDFTQIEGVFDLDGLDIGDDIETYEDALWEGHRYGFPHKPKPGLY